LQYLIKNFYTDGYITNVQRTYVIVTTFESCRIQFVLMQAAAAEAAAEAAEAAAAAAAAAAHAYSVKARIPF
jgi:type IV secretory pathway VirB9-like protein